MTGKLIKFAAVGVVAVGISGCANNEELRAQIDQAMQTAQAAQQTANSAQQTAQSAQQTANKALSVAKEAKAAAQANSKRIDRAFEASMRK